MAYAKLVLEGMIGVILLGILAVMIGRLLPISESTESKQRGQTRWSNFLFFGLVIFGLANLIWARQNGGFAGVPFQDHTGWHVGRFGNYKHVTEQEAMSIAWWTIRAFSSMYVAAFGISLSSLFGSKGNPAKVATGSV